VGASDCGIDNRVEEVFVRMYVYISIFVHVYIHIFIHTYVYIYVCMHMLIHLNVNIDTYLHIDIFIFAYGGIRKRVQRQDVLTMGANPDVLTIVDLSIHLYLSIESFCSHSSDLCAVFVSNIHIYICVCMYVYILE